MIEFAEQEPEDPGKPVKPEIVSPAEVRIVQSRRVKRIPLFVFEAVSRLLTRSPVMPCVINMCDLVEEIQALTPPGEMRMTEIEMLESGWFNIEPALTASGWHVEFRSDAQHKHWVCYELR